MPEQNANLFKQRTNSRHSMSSAKSIKEMSSSMEPPPKHAKRVTFGKQRADAPNQTEMMPSGGSGGDGDGSGGKSAKRRQRGGLAKNSADRKVPRTNNECNQKPIGHESLAGTNVSCFEVKMHTRMGGERTLGQRCDFFPKFHDNAPFKDQTTQTLYRESSAQTVAYLPDIMDKEQDQYLELFNLASLLPGDKPPGLYEVEILERARKRWSFSKALKTNLQRQIREARELAIKSKYKTLLQAFEWEQWIEREEYIQECQMMRLEIVIRMFDKREREMHSKTKTRIEIACERIQMERQEGFAKNEMDFNRSLRRLKREYEKVPMKWKKQSAGESLGSPISEFYGPLMRHGVDPARRHYKPKQARKAFDMRIDALEKRVSIQQLQCPFTKLKEWSKPKEIVKEVEMNFCSDKNLQNMYESLKRLRTQADMQKITPKCLKKRPQMEVDRVSRIMYDYEALDSSGIYRQTFKTTYTPPVEYTPEQELAFTLHEERVLREKEDAKELFLEQRQEELEHLLHMHEGTTIGWIMQFLCDEMERLKEQRKLHFFSILAQKERWRREAAEAGLRQKENDMRYLYEELFQQSHVVNSEVANEYVDTILSTDMSHVAEHKATEHVVELAKEIDIDIQRWLESFKLIQTPLTYEPLRYALRDMIFPKLEDMLARHEKNLVVRYIIDDILFPNMWETLEPFDIASTLASDLIDRLIDNDLYLFSTESENDEKPSHNEAEAIIRKLIRQAVTGRRWKTENERIVHENTDDLLGDVFQEMLRRLLEDPPIVEPSLVHSVEKRMLISQSDGKHSSKKAKFEADRRESLSPCDSQLIKQQLLTIMKKMKKDKITKNLTSDDVFVDDDEEPPIDEVVKMEIYRRLTKKFSTESLASIFSAVDIPEIPNFQEARQAYKKMKTEKKGRKSSVLSMDIGVKFEETKKPSQTQTSTPDKILSALSLLIPEERSFEDQIYEADDEQSVLDENERGSVSINWIPLDAGNRKLRSSTGIQIDNLFAAHVDQQIRETLRHPTAGSVFKANLGSSHHVKSEFSLLTHTVSTKTPVDTEVDDEDEEIVEKEIKLQEMGIEGGDEDMKIKPDTAVQEEKAEVKEEAQDEVEENPLEDQSEPSELLQGVAPENELAIKEDIAEPELVPSEVEYPETNQFRDEEPIEPDQFPIVELIEPDKLPKEEPIEAVPIEELAEANDNGLSEEPSYESKINEKSFTKLNVEPMPDPD